jgi:hypothetical protein
MGFRQLWLRPMSTMNYLLNSKLSQLSSLNTCFFALHI